MDQADLAEREMYPTPFLCGLLLLNTLFSHGSHRTSEAALKTAKSSRGNKTTAVKGSHAQDMIGTTGPRSCPVAWVTFSGGG